MPDAVLELREVHKLFGTTAAVDGLSLAIQPGEVFTLLGPSGCGKSTTLRMVAGLEEPDAGEVFLDGNLIASGDKGFSLPPERRNLGMVFQSYAIWPHMTVFDNVAFPLHLRGMPKHLINAKVASVLDLVGLTGLGSRGGTWGGGGGGGWGSRAQSCTSRSCCCWTSRSATWMRVCASTCASNCARSSSAWALPCCSSRTTRSRRWSCRTASRSCRLGVSNRSARRSPCTSSRRPRSCATFSVAC